MNKTIVFLKTELEEKYIKINMLNISNIDFLYLLNDYINFIKNNDIFNKIYVNMKEDSAKESIQVIQESVHNKYALSIHEYESEEGLAGNYPISEYEQLIDFPEEFNFIKDLKNEEEISKIKIVIDTDTPYGKGSKHTSGSGLLMMVKLNIYSKQLKSLHEYFIERLNWINEHGVFSQSLDFNNEKGILYFNGKEIFIDIKKSISNAHYLLNYLFKNNPFEQHFCDDLNDGKALLEDEKHWKSYYDACVDIQNKVKKITDVEDFLDFNSGKGMYVRLNPKYSLNVVV